MDKNKFTRFIIDVCKIALTVIIIASPILYFNVVIDPYSVFRKTIKNTMIEPNKRYLKIDHVLKNKDKYNSFIFGSSRVGSINPNIIPDAKYYNMTYSLGFPEHHLRDLKRFVNNGVKVENIIIGIDYLSLMRKHNISEDDLLRKEYPINPLKKVAFFWTYLVSRPSWLLVDAATKPVSYLDNSHIYETGLMKNLIIDSIIDNNPSRHISSLKFSYSGIKDDVDKDMDAAFSDIESIIEFADSKNIETIIYIHPTHQTTYLNINLDNYFHTLTKLSEITNFWDFSGLNSITTDNTLHYETSHYRSSVSDKIIARIFSLDNYNIPDDFGRLVTKNNIQNHIEFHKKLLTSYFEYGSPIYSDSDYLNISESNIKNNKDQIQLLSINNLSLSSLMVPTVIATPWLMMKAETLRPINKHFLERLYIRVGERVIPLSDYIVKDHSSKPPHKNNVIEFIIPISLLDEGEQIMGFMIKKPLDSLYKKISINHSLLILKSRQSIDINNLRVVNRPALFNVDKINEIHSGNFKELNDKKFLKITGWALNSDTSSISGGVIAYLDGKPYHSQIVYKRPDLANHMGNKGVIDCGWGITIPVFNIKRGVHKLSFHVLSNDMKSYNIGNNSIVFSSFWTSPAELKKSLTKINKPTRFSIDRVNNVTAKSQKKHTIHFDGQKITMAGWAFDFPMMESASCVLLEINDKLFPVNYGLSRPDLSRKFKNDSIEYSGWQIRINPQIIGKGKHNVNVIIVNQEETKYYEIKTKVVLNIL